MSAILTVVSFLFLGAYGYMERKLDPRFYLLKTVALGLLVYWMVIYPEMWR